MRNNFGKLHTQLDFYRSDTQGVHRIFRNGQSEYIAPTFTCSGVPLDMPEGTTTIAHRGRKLTGGTINNSSSSFFFSSSTLSKYPLVIIPKNEDNSGEHHTLNNPWFIHRGPPGVTRFLAGYPITGPISGNSAKIPSLSSTGYVLVGGVCCRGYSSCSALWAWLYLRPDSSIRHAKKWPRTERRRCDREQMPRPR
jgi:hypothetical protein